jgi:hypothetical protein
MTKSLLKKGTLPTPKELKRYMELRKAGYSIRDSTNLAVESPRYYKKTRGRKKK